MTTPSDIKRTVESQNVEKSPVRQGISREGCVYQGRQDGENTTGIPSLISRPLERDLPMGGNR
ncbi:MAG: hypothetical protein KDN20_22010 [Verrucomicrobiae bacterium]|nr:hypothetical protein [Verrucomicrobiae bacterium]